MLKTFFYRKTREELYLTYRLAVIYGESAAKRDWHWIADKPLTNPEAYYGFGYSLHVLINGQNFQRGEWPARYVAKWITAYQENAPAHPFVYDCPWENEYDYYYSKSRPFDILTPAQADAVCREVFMRMEPAFPQREIPLSAFLLEAPQ